MIVTNNLVKRAIKNGGLTFKHNKTNVKTGFMVSQASTEQIVNITNSKELTNNINSYIKSNPLETKNQYYGLWFNDNKCYIDISHRINSKHKALEFAKQEKQLAIFDNKNKKSINL